MKMRFYAFFRQTFQYTYSGLSLECSDNSKHLRPKQRRSSDTKNFLNNITNIEYISLHKYGVDMHHKAGLYFVAAELLSLQS